jgi:hypothetical protein
VLNSDLFLGQLVLPASEAIELTPALIRNYQLSAVFAPMYFVFSHVRPRVTVRLFLVLGNIRKDFSYIVLL